MCLSKSTLRFRVLSKTAQDYSCLGKRQKLAMKVEFFSYGVFVGVLLAIIIAAFSV